MKKHLTILAAMLLVVSVSASAQDGGKKKKKDSKKAKTEQVATPAPAAAGAQRGPGGPGAPAAEKAPENYKAGLFGVAKTDKDWYFEIPDSLLGRRILVVTRYHSNTAGAGVYGGEEIDDCMVYWEKGANGNLLLRVDTYTIKSADENQAINKAVAVSSENPIVGSFKPEKNSPKGASRIKVTSFLEDDNSVMSLGNAKKRFNLSMPKREATFVNSVRTYPINTEVTVTRTFAYQAAQGMSSGPQASTRIPAGAQTGVVTMVLNTSFVLLPEVPMQPRQYDPRVGFFAAGVTEFSDDQQGVETLRYITRWRLEARPEDVEKQKRGELVEPIKPIVYYIDPATPEQWRPYLIAGINDWNKAFEKAGWKNAIRGEMFPDDPDMSMEDARFSVIRYLASPIANAYGPNVHDPRSGEIIESHIGWYHNVMTLVHDWYQVQVGAIDPRAQKMKYDEELMGDLIRFVSSHEVGHTLGLRHNMGSSSQTPVEKLRDKEWVEKNGHTISIMDYARFNYVAQPEDGITKDGIYPRINDYDDWAIEFGYKPTYLETMKEDHLYWNKEIIARLEANPRLWFGGEGRDSDPRAQTEDLGDNSVKASEYGVKNLKRVVVAIPEWNKEEADMYANVKRMYEAVVSQYNRYMGHVMTNIGGRYITERSIEMPGPKYQAVPKQRQKEALKYINDYLFVKPSWLVEVPYISNLTDTPDKYLYTIVNNVVSASGVLAPAKLDRMAAFAQQDKANYKPEEYLNDLYNYVFAELNNGKNVDSYRRYIQRKYVAAALDVVNSKANQFSDSRTLVLAELVKIQTKAKARVGVGDAVTKAHWQEIVKTIEKGLDPATPATAAGSYPMR